MNRFRSRKKSIGERTPNRSRRASLEQDIPPLPSFSSRTFKRKKQVLPEPKPEIDLASALPASDDFRTSLLMPKLSARFSMLREQDDPNSKIGKANDDSVLFPKRASKLDLFSRQGLSDISEVDSVRGSIRPPFTQARTDSYGSAGYDTDEGGVISRSRPGEGNTMFGGRQKIYKIPVNGSGSVKTFGSTEDGELPVGGNMGGKALYESDIATSAFQKLREEEKRQESEQLAQQDKRPSKEQDRSGSPPSAKYNRNRETSSSTNSGPSQSRISTAATSVASQKSIYGAHEAINGSQAVPSNAPTNPASADRPFGKNRRLYGQGLDQHMYEQQSSVLHRLESIQRSRTPVGGPIASPMSTNLPQSRSASNLNDRYQRGGPPYAPNSTRAGSPPPSGTPPRMQDFDLGLTPDNTSTAPHADSGYGRSPPLSRPMSPSQDPNGQDAFVAALEPNDLGKATASGAFNKPRKQYNEHQYLQRQLALQEGRGTPSPQLIRPFSPTACSIDEQTTGRSRDNSLGSTFSKTNSSRQPWEHHMEDRVLRAVPESASPPPGSHHRDQNDQNFLNGLSGSDISSESDTEPTSPVPSSRFDGYFHPNSQPTPAVIPFQPNLNTDLNNLQLSPEEASDGQSYRSGTTITQPPVLRNDSAIDIGKEPALEADSPTLGPVGISNGLSGLVHQHLRNDSGTSSIYPEETPDLEPLPTEIRDSIFGHASALTHSRQQSKETNGDQGTSERPPSAQSSIAAPPPLSFAARHILERATALRDNQNNPKAQQMLGNNKAQQILGGEAPRSGHAQDNSTTWQEQLKAHHARVGSTETQNEREALASELAERRRMVQDNLKHYVEVDERSRPGSRAMNDSPAKPAQPHGILEKTSKGSLVGKQERPTKAMKMLGIGPGTDAATVNGTDQPRVLPDIFVGRNQISDRAMPPRQRLPPHPVQRPQDVPQHLHTPPTPSRQREPVSPRSQENLTKRPSPRSSKSGSSYSDKSDRRSPEVHQGNTARGHTEGTVNGYSPNGTGPASQTHQPSLDAPRITEETMARAHNGGPPAERSQSAMSNRMQKQSNSRNAPTGYFEPRVAPPGTPFMINPSSSRSAPSPYSYTASSASTPNESRPSFSSASSHTMHPPQKSPTRHGLPRSSNHRKRSINKHDISEPTFISCTSSVDTVNLPEGASLSNGMDSPPSEPSNAPPIPARDSRRKRTQTLLQALGRIEKPEASPSAYSPSPKEDDLEERSTFSADDEPAPKSMKQRLRKTSSEGGSMAQKARQQAMHAPAPDVPNLETQTPPTGDHVPYQARQDVPASAVMF